jgi:hypothetical protein
MGIKSQMEMVLARLLAGGGVAALFTFGTESTMLALCGSIAPRVAKASFSSVNWGEKRCIRIPVAFRLYLVKIIQILTN